MRGGSLRRDGGACDWHTEGAVTSQSHSPPLHVVGDDVSGVLRCGPQGGCESITLPCNGVLWLRLSLRWQRTQFSRCSVTLVTQGDAERNTRSNVRTPYHLGPGSGRTTNAAARLAPNKMLSTIFSGPQWRAGRICEVAAITVRVLQLSDCMEYACNLLRDVNTASPVPHRWRLRQAFVGKR
jgi:hypothetical protein